VTNNKLDNITWSLEYYKGTNVTPFTSTKTVVDNKATYTYNGVEATENQINEYSLNYLPHLTSDNMLNPSPMYLNYHNENTQRIYVVAVAKTTVAIDEYAAGTVVWAQPILITQNQYNSATINKWDGGLSIDEDNGTILSTMVGAGRKNERNLFEGVLMGDVGTGSKDNSITSVGLYGFHDGA
jgi:hypothetical protein